MTTLDAYATFLTARWDEQEVRSECDPHCPTSYHQAACDCSAKMTRADLAAKRAVLKLHADDTGRCWICDEPDRACETVTALAAPFRDHPDHPANREA